MWAESEGFVEDVVVHLGDVAAVEGREAVHHLVGDHSQTPPVHRPAVVLFLEHLWSEVLGGTTECGGCVTWRGVGGGGGGGGVRRNRGIQKIKREREVKERRREVYVQVDT